MHTTIPAPLSVEMPGGGDFVVSANTVIGVTPATSTPPGLRIPVGFHRTGAGSAPPRVETASAPAAGMIHLAIGPVEGPGDDGYRLTVATDRVTVAANHSAGLFYAVQTLKQLLPAFVQHEAYRSDEHAPVLAPAVRSSIARASPGAARCSTSRGTSSPSTRSSATST